LLSGGMAKDNKKRTAKINTGRKRMTKDNQYNNKVQHPALLAGMVHGLLSHLFHYKGGEDNHDNNGATLYGNRNENRNGNGIQRRD
jgi:hypothetical protein